MKFYIWSFEHNQWWRPNCFGYTSDINEAGEYDIEDATQICQNANIFTKSEALLPADKNKFLRERE